MITDVDKKIKESGADATNCLKESMENEEKQYNDQISRRRSWLMLMRQIQRIYLSMGF